jgi:hypothetical protein
MFLGSNCNERGVPEIYTWILRRKYPKKPLASTTDIPAAVNARLSGSGVATGGIIGVVGGVIELCGEEPPPPPTIG